MTEQATQQQEQKEVELKLETGEVFKGASWEEVARKAAEAQQNTKTVYQQEKQQREALEAQMEALKPKPEPQNGEINYDPYWALINSGKVIEAQNWLDAKRFQFDSPDEVVPTFTGAVQKTKELSDRYEIGVFQMQHPDFPATEEASKLLIGTVKSMKAEWDANTLGIVYQGLVKAGKIKPLETEEKPALGNNPPPGSNVGGGGAQPTEDEVAKFAAMTLEEQEAFLRQKGIMG